ncbi:type II secretion system protein GspM [Novosphingobium huizhouense]|uniref:type II secretion system protein GspM n=1 Tax=Novosphingobium huizhouense TaxID=2866625 RepID=UPI001CD8DDDF|nr:type II secretion system protein GspM [Novosphingobium huizhouense]
MIGRLARWRRALTARERFLVDLAAAITAAVVLVYGVVLPLGAAFDAAARRHTEVVRRTAAIEAVVRALDAAPRRTPALRRAGGPLDQALSASAQAAGFVVTAIEPRGPALVHAVIGGARAGAAFAWLERLDGEGLVIESLRASPAPDGALSLDMVVRAR